MSSKVTAIVKPELLVWARQSAGLSLEEAARKGQLSFDRLNACERGESKLTIAQLRKLAQVYKRPLAVFYLSRPPTFDALRDQSSPHDRARHGSRPHSNELTVEEFCSYVAPEVWDQETLLTWPPDVFAVVASLLLKSGAYCHAVSGWKRRPSLKDWVKEIKAIGAGWAARPDQPPAKLLQWHRTLIAKHNRKVAVSQVRTHPALSDALLQMSAVADESCAGVGLATLPTGKSNALLGEASQRLYISTKTTGASTLCKRVAQSVVRVLPKLHTPQSGVTIRSLTHNLALCPAGDVKPKWSERIIAEHGRSDCLNLLLVPWPRTVNPRHFRSVKPKKADLRDMPEGFGFFEYMPPHSTDDLRVRLRTLLRNTMQVVAKIDGVVFPELALTTEQYEAIKADLMRLGIFLICGVRKPGQNYLRFDIPVTVRYRGKAVREQLQHQQKKHHRWRLDKRQIVQYGLGSCLNVGWKWWENTAVAEREIHFVALEDWLTICALICEDLARQDPVAEVVRAVGPNLVIALLMDGPQLTSRWSARYATVLADDPGSSVLTLTSIGMCELSRPPSIREASRVVALWKDAETGEAVPIELPDKADGVVLSLSSVFRNEWTADGRDDGNATGYPTLSGIHYVSSDKQGSH
jgi:transcriptional regulator with XRE-family HTH domain